MDKIIQNFTDRSLAISTRESQFRQVMEECAELTVAMNQYLRSRVESSAVIEEIADVEIMMSKLKYMLGVDKVSFDDLKAAKLEKWESQLQAKEDERLKKPYTSLDAIIANEKPLKTNGNGWPFGGLIEWPDKGGMFRFTGTSEEWRKQYLGEFTPSDPEATYRHDPVYNPEPKMFTGVLR